MRIFSSTIKLLLLLTMASACHSGMICPAFQSSFILDDSVRVNTFSLFGPDSLPKNYMVDKGKYGIIEPLSYSRKYNSFKSIQMETVFPPGLPPSDSSKVVPSLVPADSLQEQISKSSTGK